MLPDDNLKNRLRERFDNYEPEPVTPWQQIEKRLPRVNSRLRWLAVAVVGLMLIAGGAGIWINWKAPSMNLLKSNPARSADAKSPTTKSPNTVANDRINKAISNALSTPVPNVSTDVDPIAGIGAVPGKKSVIAMVKVKSKQQNESVLIASNADRNNPRLHHNPVIDRNFPPVLNRQELAVSPEQQRQSEEPVGLERQLLLPSREISAKEVDDFKLMLKHPIITHLTVAYSLPPITALVPSNAEDQAIATQKHQSTWLFKGGPLLSYSVMQSRPRENNSARALQNLYPSLTERLGWYGYFGQQRHIARNRWLEMGAVFRQFRQGVQYEVPNGLYSVAIQPDQSVTVTEVRDTLTNRTVVRQVGLRLGYGAPINFFQKLNWGLGGEAVYQFNLKRVIINAEATLGTTLSLQSRNAVQIELYVNSAIRPVYDAHAWVRVLPYNVGLRVGVPLPIRR